MLTPENLSDGAKELLTQLHFIFEAHLPEEPTNVRLISSIEAPADVKGFAEEAVEFLRQENDCEMQILIASARSIAFDNTILPVWDKNVFIEVHYASGIILHELFIEPTKSDSLFMYGPETLQ